MPEYQYRFTGRLVLGGVTFYIQAPDETEAQRLAMLGKYDEYDADGAETVDSHIDKYTLQPNT